MNAVIETQGLSRAFEGVRALADVDLSVTEGSITGLIGPNGAGKTTLLRILAGLDSADSGTAKVCGTLCGSSVLDEERPPVGFVPDHQGVYDRLSVREYLTFFASAHGLPLAGRAVRVESVLELTGLTPLGGKEASALSRGVTQRLSLARALIADPEVLLLDEPASGLDPRARVSFFELLLELKKRGKTLLISSHILKELAELVDAVAVLEAGKLVALGTIDAVLAKADQNPGHTRVRIELIADATRGAKLLEHAVEEVVADGDKVLRVSLDGDASAISPVLEILLDADLAVVGVEREGHNLEDAFLALTRDEVV